MEIILTGLVRPALFSRRIQKTEENSTTIAATSAGSPQQGMFASLRIRNYRLYLSGQLSAYLGFWMQRVAQDWLVLKVSGNSPAALGTAVALQFTPVLLLSLWAGSLADRLDKRRMLIALQTLIGVQSLALGMMDVAGAVRLWHVYLFCVILGCLTALENPVRQAFVSEIVGQRQIFNAAALTSTVYNSMRLVGPALAGFAIVWVGTGWLFVGIAASTAAMVAGLAAINNDTLFRGVAVSSEKAQVRAGLRYILARTDLSMVLALMFVVSTAGFTFVISFALVSVQVFHVESDGYGLLTALFAAGTLAGSLMAVQQSTHRQPSLRRLLWAAGLFGGIEFFVAFMPTYLAFGIALIPLGYVALLLMNTASSLAQIMASPQMRGRVMGLYVLVMLGGNPIAGPIVGWLTSTFGGRSPFWVGGLISAAAAATCAVILRHKGSKPLSLIGATPEFHLR